MFLLRHLKKNTIAYMALFVALGGTSYASVKIPQHSATTQAAKSAKAGISCGGSCPAAKVMWAYIGVNGLINSLVRGAPTVYDGPLGGIPAQVNHLGLGDWLVFFQQQDLSNCARFVNLTHDRGSASASGYDNGRTQAFSPGQDNARINSDKQGVHVLTTDTAGNAADLDFAIVVFCAKAPNIQFGAAPPAAGLAPGEKPNPNP